MAYFKQSGRVDELAPAHLALGQLALRRGANLPTAERQIRQALAYTAELQQTAQVESVVALGGIFVGGGARE